MNRAQAVNTVALLFRRVRSYNTAGEIVDEFAENLTDALAALGLLKLAPPSGGTTEFTGGQAGAYNTRFGQRQDPGEEFRDHSAHPTPADVIAAVALGPEPRMVPRWRPGDPVASPWRIGAGPDGADRIIKALEDGGYTICRINPGAITWIPR